MKCQYLFSPRDMTKWKHSLNDRIHLMLNVIHFQRAGNWEDHLEIMTFSRRCIVLTRIMYVKCVITWQINVIGKKITWGKRIFQWRTVSDIINWKYTLSDTHGPINWKYTLSDTHGPINWKYTLSDTHGPINLNVHKQDFQNKQDQKTEQKKRWKRKKRVVMFEF